MFSLRISPLPHRFFPAASPAGRLILRRLAALAGGFLALAIVVTGALMAGTPHPGRVEGRALVVFGAWALAVWAASADGRSIFRGRAAIDDEGRQGRRDLIFAAACLLGVAGIVLTFRSAGIQAAEQAVVRQLLDAGGPPVRFALERVSDAVSRPILLRWLPAVALFLVVVRRWRSVRFFLAAVAGGGALELLTKALVVRPRPEQAALQLDSFPSGHMLAATVAASSLALIGLAACRHPWQRRLVIGLACGWIALTGISRVYLARHYPTDVLGALLLGLGWVAACRAMVFSLSEPVEAAGAVTGEEGQAAAVAPRLRWRLRRRGAVKLGLALLLAVLFIGPWPIDRATYLNQAYFRHSVDGLDQALAGLPSAAGPVSGGPAGVLSAGYGEELITARRGEPLAGYSQRWGMPCQGAHDPQRVRVLALSDGRRRVAIIAADLLLVGDSLADEVTRRLEAPDGTTPGLPRSQIYFTATHTHSGPGGFGTHWIDWSWLGRSRQDTFDRLAGAITAAARRALGSLQPAEWGYASTEVPNLIRNRVARKAPVDAELSLFSVRQLQPERAAAGAGARPGMEFRVVVFGAHPTILGYYNRLASSDYPGFLTTYLERNPRVKAMFCAGAVGSATTGGLGRQRNFFGAERYGQQLGAQAEALAATLRYRRHAVLNSLYAPVEMGPVQFRVAGSLRASPLLAGLVVGRREGCIQALSLDNLLFLGAAADVNGELSTAVKAAARARGFQPVVTSFAGRYVGYLLPEEYYDRYDDQETRLMAMYGPATGPYFTDLLTRVVQRFPQPN